MPRELELKAVVTDPRRLRATLAGAGAHPGFRGMLRDRRLDRGGELQARDQVLRLRHWTPREGGGRTEVGWKGPAAVTGEGYKAREEIEFGTDDGPAAAAALAALGYVEVHAIDRYVEVYELAGGVVRLEWYPRMDILVEIEGAPEELERLIKVLELPRSAWSPEPLTAFAGRYADHAGRPAILAEAELAGEPPHWITA